MITNRILEFLYQDAGQIEAVAFGPRDRQSQLITEGYRDSGIPDLMIDLHPDTHQPYCFMSMSFDKSYPLVIWGLRLLMNDERFDLPQAGLKNVSLAEAFSWAYTHFVLGEETPPSVGNRQHASLTRQVLQHALVGV